MMFQSIQRSDAIALRQNLNFPMFKNIHCYTDTHQNLRTESIYCERKILSLGLTAVN